MASVRATIKLVFEVPGVSKADLQEGVNDLIDAVGLTEYLESELLDYLPEESEAEECSVELDDATVS